MNVSVQKAPAEELNEGLPPGADPHGIFSVILLSAFPSPERVHSQVLNRQVQALFPQAQVVNLFLPGVTASSNEQSADASAAPSALFLVQALELCLSQQPKRPERGSLTTSAPADVLR